MKMPAMSYETFRVKRAQIANQIYEVLSNNPPKDAIEIHRPDSLGAVGIDYGKDGYILIQMEEG